MTPMSFAPYIRRWKLIADGDPITTPTARLLPVLWRGEPAMLKLSREREECLAGAVMAWWGGQGAARVFAQDHTALLMERATGPGSLAAMARGGEDDAACRILCAVAARLHAARPAPAPALIPLADWFGDLAPAAARHGGILIHCAKTACELLEEPRECAVLHGDLHHGNVLDFGARGWLAIDPKQLVGERGFDFANIFINPDLADPTRPVATEPGRFTRRLTVVAEAAGLERQRLLRWILAWTGLSAAWFLAEADPLAAVDLRIAALAAAELDR